MCLFFNHILNAGLSPIQITVVRSSGSAVFLMLDPECINTFCAASHNTDGFSNHLQQWSSIGRLPATLRTPNARSSHELEMSIQYTRTLCANPTQKARTLLQWQIFDFGLI